MSELPNEISPALVAQHAAGLRALVSRLVLDDSRVDDVLQETWLTAIKRPPRNPAALGAWLRTVAIRLAGRSRRSEFNRQRHESQATVEEPVLPADEVVAREMARRKVVDAVVGLGERTLFLRGLIPWLGFRHCDIDYVPDARLHGSSQYSLRRMLALAVDGITASSIRPLRLSTVLGVVMSTLAMIYVVYALAIKLFVGTAISGWTSLLVGVMLMGGVQLMILGILGEYLGKVLVVIKGRPNYIVREKSQARAPSTASVGRSSAALRTVTAERKSR